MKNCQVSSNQVISHEHLELLNEYLSDQHQQNFSCDYDMNDAVFKRIKNRTDAFLTNVPILCPLKTLEKN